MLADGQTSLSFTTTQYGLIYASDTLKMSPSSFYKVTETSFLETDHQYPQISGLILCRLDLYTMKHFSEQLSLIIKRYGFN